MIIASDETDEWETKLDAVEAGEAAGENEGQGTSRRRWRNLRRSQIKHLVRTPSIYLLLLLVSLNSFGTLRR